MYRSFGKYLLMAMLLLFVRPLCAQRFSVERFRVLPNDISAYIHPERDLNGEACALIKVVGSRDFVFSTPLGIVKRKNDVGEIWLYVPKGTVQITIKHPEWGVLRDYRFSEPLESRLTYELVLIPPVVNRIAYRAIPPIGRNAAFCLPLLRDSLPLPVSVPVEWKPLREFSRFLLMADVTLGNEAVSAGIRLGWMRRHGVYVHLSSDFRSTPDVDGRECDADGEVEGSDVPPYYTGKVFRSRSAVLLGATHRIWRGFYVYEGAGYGQRIVAWETTEGALLRNKSYSAQGVALEAGVMWSPRKWVVSAGASVIEGKYWEANFGIGVRI